MTLRHIIFAVAAVALTPLSHAEGFNVRTGAWEVTTASTVSGMPVPKDALARMPPEQRAKIEAAMAARAGKTSASTSTTCVTKEDLERGQLTKSGDARCTRKVIAQTASRYEMEETCAGPEPSKTHAKFEAQSAERYTAVLDRLQGERGRVRVELTGRWIGAACQKGGG